MEKYFIFTDGSKKTIHNHEIAGFGVLIKNEKNEVIVEYHEEIKNKDFINEFEILAVLKSFEIAKEKGFKNIVSYCDYARDVIHLNILFDRLDTVTKEDVRVFNNLKESKKEILSKIKELSKSFDSFEFNYIPRKQNKKTDSLAARSTLESFSEYYSYIEKIEKDSIAFLEDGEGLKFGKVLFSYKNYLKIPNKYSVEITSKKRNKKVAEFCNNAKNSFDYFLTIDLCQINRISFFKGFYQTINGEKINLPKSNHLVDLKIKNQIASFSEYLIDVLKLFDTSENLWIDVRSPIMKDFIEQRKTINNYEGLSLLKDLIFALNKFDNVLFHSLPNDMKEKKTISKKSIIINNDNVNLIIEKAKEANLENKKIFFSQLITFHINKYKKENGLLSSSLISKDVIEDIRNDIGGKIKFY